MCSKLKILLASLLKSNCSMIIISRKQFDIFETVFRNWETKRNTKTSSIVQPAQYNQNLDFSNKSKILNVIFSFAYTPKSFYFRFRFVNHACMSPSSEKPQISKFICRLCVEVFQFGLELISSSNTLLKYSVKYSYLLIKILIPVRIVHSENNYRKTE